jgi:hypothetical protein
MNEDDDDAATVTTTPTTTPTAQSSSSTRAHTTHFTNKAGHVDHVQRELIHDILDRGKLSHVTSLLFLFSFFLFSLLLVADLFL